ncbi:MAG: alpha/beta fold hydrolase [Thermoplasmataceae archaeon]
MPEKDSILLRGSEVFYRKETRRKNSRNLVLLHGMSFTSYDWKKINAFNLFSLAGFNVFAPDYPGFGNSKENEEFKITPDFSNTSKFVAEFTSGIGLENFSIIGPSMGGGIVLRSLLDLNNISSAVVIGAAGISNLSKNLEKIKTPLMIMWGSNDQIIDAGQATILNKAVHNSKLVIVPDAGHALYLEKEKVFFDAVIPFLKEIG